ncbi:hypothetical protein BDB01DRAFT_780077 [Pilobolus umbonatus]|nr:hypothetical protein BDB01DRAFT_780077 [Pilobolus umbonatus]
MLLYHSTLLIFIYWSAVFDYYSMLVHKVRGYRYYLSLCDIPVFYFYYSLCLICTILNIIDYFCVYHSIGKMYVF